METISNKYFFVDFLKSVRALLEKKESSKSQVFFTFEFSLRKLELVVSGLRRFMKKTFFYAINSDFMKQD